MLVLRRSRGQSFVIGKNAEIVIKVLNDENGVISIGIDAPKNIPINRTEIFDKSQNTPPNEILEISNKVYIKNFNL